MTNLSANFTRAEFEQSDTAARRGLFNRMNGAQAEAAKLLCKAILEPIRAYYGKAIIVSSGFRSATLNKIIGGSSSSQHCKGEAVDFRVQGIPQQQVYKDIKSGKIKIPYDQLIDEFGEHGWIHISHRAGYNRGDNLKARKIGKKVVYTPD